MFTEFQSHGSKNSFGELWKMETFVCSFMRSFNDDKKSLPSNLLISYNPRLCLVTSSLCSLQLSFFFIQLTKINIDGVIRFRCVDKTFLKIFISAPNTFLCCTSTSYEIFFILSRSIVASLKNKRNRNKGKQINWESWRGDRD